MATKTQTKYTNDQIRGAILRAADRIGGSPSSYNFFRSSVPSCGTTGCMWGWIGRELGVRVGALNVDVCEAIGVKTTTHLYNFCTSVNGYTSPHDTASVSLVLRAYADKFFPASSAPTLDSAYLAFRAAFTGAMEAA